MADFEATCRGAKCGKKITMITYDPTRKPHPYDPPTRCPRCKGKGKVRNMQADLFNPGEPALMDCLKCKGAGTVRRSHFDTCPDAAQFRAKV